MATFSTWNPSDKSASVTLSNGNLTAASSSGTWVSGRGTISKSSNKWYWEVTIQVNANSMVGIGTSAVDLSTHAGVSANGYVYHSGGNKFNNNTGVAYGATFTSGDIISVAWDMDAGTLIFWKNGTSQGTAYTGLSGTFFAIASVISNGQQTANFGASAFAYTPPSGYSAGLADVFVGGGGPANLKKLSTNLKANVKKISTNAIANVKKVSTNA